MHFYQKAENLHFSGFLAKTVIDVTFWEALLGSNLRCQGKSAKSALFTKRFTFYEKVGNSWKSAKFMEKYDFYEKACSNHQYSLGEKLILGEGAEMMDFTEFSFTMKQKRIPTF